MDADLLHIPFFASITIPAGGYFNNTTFPIKMQKGVRVAAFEHSILCTNAGTGAYVDAQGIMYIDAPTRTSNIQALYAGWSNVPYFKLSNLTALSNCVIDLSPNTTYTLTMQAAISVPAPGILNLTFILNMFYYVL